MAYQYHYTDFQKQTRKRARCSSVVRASSRGAMGLRIDPSWWTHLAISRSSQCSTTGVTKAVMGAMGLWDGAYKRFIAAIRK